MQSVIRPLHPSLHIVTRRRGEGAVLRSSLNAVRLGGPQASLQPPLPTNPISPNSAGLLFLLPSGTSPLTDWGPREGIDSSPDCRLYSMRLFYGHQ
jgi:hypothetical protein